MKKNDWILLGSVAVYSYLFYQQSAGINWLLFTILLITLLFIKNKEVYKNPLWLLAAAGSLLSASCVAYYGNGLSLTANIISLCILSAYSIERRTSVVLSFFFSVYSMGGSVVFMILDAIERYRTKVVASENRSGSVKLMLYIVPFLIVILFFFMYKASNPVFDNFTQKINLDFITAGWFFFTMSGLFLMYGFFYHKTIKEIAIRDQSASNSLHASTTSGNGMFSGFLTLDNEKLSGVILLLLLNILLFVVNALDLNFLWFDGTLPKDLSYSAFVHQGTGALISSIIIAILIILFYFRGSLNFHSGNRTLKILAAVWIIQNAFMIISTAYRNNLYINEYSLTYKRIGVYVWLLLVLIGLITTFIKIQRAKSNWYLFRTNGWLFYAVLVISAAISWDSIVTGFNINRAKHLGKPLDVRYLLSLSPKGLPQLMVLNDSTKVQTSYENERGVVYIDSSNYDYKPELNFKLYCFLGEMQKRDWQSIAFDKENTFRKIKNMKQQIKEIRMPNCYVQTIKPFEPLEQLETINFSNNRLEDLVELQAFSRLKSLNLDFNNLDTITHFPYLENLENLSLTNNNIIDISALKNAPNLITLDLATNPWLDIKTLPTLKKLISLKLSASNNSGNNYLALQRLPQLSELDISGTIINKSIELPVLPQLKKLNLQNTQLVHTDTAFFQSLENFENLEYLCLADNTIENLSAAITYIGNRKESQNSNIIIPLFDHLKVLDISRTGLRSIGPLTACPGLEHLYMDGNHQIKDFETLSKLSHLRELVVSNCSLNKIEFVEYIENLEVLDISINQIKDFRPLLKLKHLKRLTVSADEQIVEQLKKALPGTKIITVATAYSGNI